ncbi:sigma factor-like helix-turn-helix DNA-binding protein [Methyloceanibacter sp.]|uniref:sigma factor-like helix-turn-helix DNA-binding protein n=1 Tax=Methyloceanibacter sp. TaxID=1965321 RepID=UPI002B971DED|nr:sigma factor-like helix-turn-helix DNA-binding protein [Methyloceanibacter sp.]HML92589.1 sigma factor-like helix-turn-helix DNA-binding protein [Methyloceanibacter sp.]
MNPSGGEHSVQAKDFHDSVRPGLVAMLPRLKRFADVLAGGREEGRGLLSRALQYMMAEQHLYQRGTALDVWAYAEVYRQWRHELSGHADPMAQAKVDGAHFAELFLLEDDGYRDDPVIAFLVGLPPQQRLTLLLVYGDGFEHEDAARILDVPLETIAARLVRMSAALTDRLSERPAAQAASIVETLYPEGHRASP